MNREINLVLETKNLILFPMTYDFVMSIMNDSKEYYYEYDLKWNSNWPDDNTNKILPIIKQKLFENGNTGFTSWLYIEKSTKLIIGDGGFMSIPNSIGNIELGYGITNDKRNLGYATEAANALVNWALQQKSVIRILASCKEGNIASYKVLKKIGMKKLEVKNNCISMYIDNKQKNKESYKYLLKKYKGLKL